MKSLSSLLQVRSSIGYLTTIANLIGITTELGCCFMMPCLHLLMLLASGMNSELCGVIACFDWNYWSFNHLKWLAHDLVFPDRRIFHLYDVSFLLIVILYCECNRKITNSLFSMSGRRASSRTSIIPYALRAYNKCTNF